MAKLGFWFLVCVLAVTSVRINKAFDESKNKTSDKEPVKATKKYHDNFNLTRSTASLAKAQNSVFASWKVERSVIKLH